MKRKRRERSRNSAKRKPLPLRIILRIVEFIELIILSIVYALINFILFLWDHKLQVFKFILFIIIAIYCFFTTKSIIEIHKEFDDFKNYTIEVNNELNSKNEENEKLQEEVNSTKEELESTKNELEELKTSKAEQEKKEKEEAERKAKELEEQQKRLAKVTSRGSSTVRTSGSKSEHQSYAYDLCINTYGWTENDYNCLVKLWNKESGWNPNAHNSSSGAHGIPQALPASKMSSEGSDYYTNGKTQIRWGLKYIKNRYGSPSKAWSHSQSKGWY